MITPRGLAVAAEIGGSDSNLHLPVATRHWLVNDLGALIDVLFKQNRLMPLEFLIRLSDCESQTKHVKLKRMGAKWSHVSRKTGRGFFFKNCLAAIPKLAACFENGHPDPPSATHLS